MARAPQESRWRLATVRIVRWTARIWGLAVVLLGLPFFVEHLAWFRGPSFPPASVTIAVGFHLVTLIGLVAAWRWEVAGACTALVGATGFTLAVGSGWRLLPIVGVVIVPPILWLCLGWLSHGHHREAHAVS